MNIQPIAIDKIVVDHANNFRRDYDQTYIATLAEDIKQNGLTNAVVVAPVAGKPGTFRLVSGFCRMQAVTKLGMSAIPAQVKDFRDEAEVAWHNLTENTHRMGLTTYELAAALAFFSDKFKATAKQLAARLSPIKDMSSGYVSGLVRLIEKLDPVIVKDWRAGHPAATVTRLQEVIGKHADDKGAQREMWRDIVKVRSAKDNGEAGDEIDNSEQPKKVKRASERNIRDALSYAKKVDAPEDVIKTLRWALGQLKTLKIHDGTVLFPVRVEDESEEEAA